MWFVFWEYGWGDSASNGDIGLDGTEPGHVGGHVERRVRGRAVLPLWLLAALSMYYYRAYFMKRAPGLMCDMLVAGEGFVGASILVTIGANVASLMHTPGEVKGSC
ncbi:unnamed protein product [Chrysoparadoxa australica]